MELRAIPEREAYAALRRESQNRNLPMVEVARTLIAVEALLRDPRSS